MARQRFPYPPAASQLTPVSRAWHRLRFAVLLAAIGCMSDSTRTPVEPSGLPSVNAAMTAAEKADKKAEHDRLMQQRDSIREEQKRMREATRAEYERARAEWEAFQKAWGQTKKENKDARIEFLKCEPQRFVGDAEVIGPAGGTLHIGAHSLVVPKGALDHEVLLVGQAPTGSKIEVDFGPHGLQFLSSAKLTLSYEHCMRPDNFTYRVVYVESGRVLEFPPSSDNKTLKKVEAPIDHFSGYMIAY